MKVCAKCFEIFHDSIWTDKKCPKCSNSKLIDVDEKIYPIQRILNQLGCKVVTFIHDPAYTVLENICISFVIEDKKNVLEPAIKLMSKKLENFTHSRQGSNHFITFSIKPVKSYYKTYLRLIKAIYDFYFCIYKACKDLIKTSGE